MKAYAIVLENNNVSKGGFDILKHSSYSVGNEFEINKFPACTPEKAFTALTENVVKWTWPWADVEIDIKLGLKKTPYPTMHRFARVACFFSHYALWKVAVQGDTPVMILEHDAKFIKKFDPKFLDSIQGDYALGINSPLGATRRDTTFNKIVHENPTEIMETPWIDNDLTVPQGLAGNSAYIITPGLARQAIQFVEDNGAWPNDAILCKQAFPGRILVTKTHYTKVQGLPSTTTK
jgi:hypothetical protein